MRKKIVARPKRHNQRPEYSQRPASGERSPRPERQSIRRAALLVVGGAVAAGLLWGALNLWVPSVAPPEVLLRRAEDSLARDDYDAAERFATWIPPGDPLWARGQLIAGEAAMRAGRVQSAAGYYQSVPRDASPSAVAAARGLGNLFHALGMLTRAEQQWAYVLAHDPQDATTHERVAYSLGTTGRRWEAVPHLMFLLRARNCGFAGMVVLGDSERPYEEEAYLRTASTNAPGDALVQLGLAWLDLAEHEHGEGNTVALLKRVVAARPDLSGAQALLGELLVVDGQEQDFLRWHASLPEAAEAHPEIWYVRGLWARRHADRRAAVRCFWETLRRAPEHRRATYQLGLDCRVLGEPAAGVISERAAQLIELAQILDQAQHTQGQHEESLRQVAKMMEGLGRLWEAWAWADIASELHPQASWPASMVERLQSQLTEDLPRTIPAANLALQYDFSHYSVPEPLLLGAARRAGLEFPDGADASLRFEEEKSAGIDFVYYGAADRATEGARMFEQTGGGVAAFDYDGDGWPDLYFTQGSGWKTGEDRPTMLAEHRDHLYRNLLGESFTDVAEHAGLENLEFGQGVAAGDFNSDGFPDLYVAHVGHNRLYRNNGDGTFSDVTEESGIIGESWTSSCLVADLNGDSLPDLFDVNYLAGEDVYQRICGSHICSPNIFSGATDQLLLNRGDGSFERSGEATLPVGGKGMGVVAAVLEGDQLPSLFIGNDQVPNFLLQLTASENGGDVQLAERALLRGLAYDAEGWPLACMGIAADDANGDGRLDLFVTNFRNEPNSLYLQDKAGLFIDGARTAGLHAPGLLYVGWGAQFLDADLDGHADLVTTNGHVDDFRDEGQPYRMPPQFFRNTGGGRFRSLSADEAGDFFGRKYLGRGLARLDWNRDGRMDFAVSNVGMPASLVTNRSMGVGRFLNVRLRGTLSARDAIGSMVEVATDQGRWTKQLVAGDGYMASNERFLQFGLGQIRSVASVRVKWPSGVTATFEDLPTDVTLEVVEGAPQATVRDGAELLRFVEST